MIAGAGGAMRATEWRAFRSAAMIPCVGIRAVPMGEAMVACVIADHYLRQRGQIGDNPAWRFPPPAR